MFWIILNPSQLSFMQQHFDLKHLFALFNPQRFTNIIICEKYQHVTLRTASLVHFILLYFLGCCQIKPQKVKPLFERLKYYGQVLKCVGPPVFGIFLKVKNIAVMQWHHGTLRRNIQRTRVHKKEMKSSAGESTFVAITNHQILIPHACDSCSKKNRMAVVTRGLM